MALIENGVIAELQVERASRRSTVGNVVLGKVTRVLPGMQAAFIEVGQERAAFLHVEDLIRPDDFEAYLSGGTPDPAPTDDDDDAEAAAATEADAGVGTDPAEADPATDESDAASADAGDAEGDSASDAEAATEEGVTAKRSRSRRRIIQPKGPSPEETAEAESTDDAAGDSPDEAVDADDADDSDADGSDGSDGSDGDAATEEDGEAEKEVAEAPDADGAAIEPAAADGSATGEKTGEGRGGRRRRRGRKKSDNDGRGDTKASDNRGRSKKKGGRNGGGGGQGGRNGGGSGGAGRGRKQTSRVSRSIPITEVVKEGDECIVQISKEPIGTKGARVTSHITLAGRYAVYLPTVEHTGVSKRIGAGRERTRLRKVIEQLKPEKGGVIVRTVAEGLTKKQLKADVGYLIKVWEEVSRRRENAKSNDTLYEELDLVLKTARDQFTDQIDKIIIDDKEQYQRLVRFMDMFLPERVNDIELYSGDEPIFDAYGIEDEISRALSRKVPLPSGGYLIIDQAEALTAIDVNTGRYVGKGSKDLEETAFKTNLEAVEEIAYQLRFRNIGGLVILDLIDMDRGSNRDKVLRALDLRLVKDKAKTTLQRISELGLVEMTRKRTRESLGRLLHEPCFYCDGTGQIQSRETIAYEILRQMRRERHTLAGYSVTVNAHPAIVDLLQNEEKDAVTEAERRLERRIEFTPRKEYHIEQFDLQGR